MKNFDSGVYDEAINYMHKVLYVIMFASIIIMFFSGCSSNECKPEIKTEIVYETKEVYKPVPCKIPKIECEFSGEGYEPTRKLLECVVLQKRHIEMCNSQ